MTKVWITGKGGMLGKDLARAFESADYEVVITGRAEVDIADEKAVRAFALQEKPALIVNAAAYNAVDQAEDEEGCKLAIAINAEGPRYLALASKEIGARLVHYSTDYVFSGEKGAPYTEDDIPDPISKYGESKALGEQYIREAHDDFIIMRVSKLFGAPGASEGSKRSFVDVMLEKAHKEDKLTIIDDETGCPTYTPHIAYATLQAVKNNVAPGVYHLINEGEGVTWYEFAKEIFEVAELDPEIEAVSADFFPRKAKRPKEVVLKNTKLPVLPSRKEALEEYIG